MTSEPNALLRLRQMLDLFVSRTDRSIDAANEIEAFLLANFPDDDGFEDLLVALASYQPGGGECLHDEESIRGVCSAALADIESRVAG